MTAAEFFQTGSKKGRGMAKATLNLLTAMYAAVEKAQPITGRGVGYKLFVRKAILEHIEPVAWARCEEINRAEQKSLKTILGNWNAAKQPPATPSAPNTTPWWLRPRSTWLARR